MQIRIRKQKKADLLTMCSVWNEIVESGDVFPQTNLLDPCTGSAFFGKQSYCGSAAFVSKARLCRARRNTGQVSHA